jgi:enoyl-CoA hydratase/carnithine racemase
MDLEISRIGRHIALWTLNRPKDNTFGGTLLKDLMEASLAAQEDDDIRVVITTGAGRAYSAGADLDQFAKLDGASMNETFHRGLAAAANPYASSSRRVEALEELGIGHWGLQWLKLDKPLIAAINGPAAGAGFCFTLLHDFRVMGPKAFLTPGFTALGVAPELGATWILPRLIGQSRATEILLLNPRIGPEEALSYGLAHRVADDPVAEAVALGERLAALPPLAVSSTLRLVRGSGASTLPDQLVREYRLQQDLWESDDFRDGVTSIMARFAATRADP